MTVVPETSAVCLATPNSCSLSRGGNFGSNRTSASRSALTASVRYNRRIDVFLGVTAYSLQSQMRTAVKSVGQIEIDEVYVAIDRQGVQYVIPVQAKGGKDQLSVVQTRQDLACCAEKFPSLVCRSVSAQFMEGDRIAMFELAIEGGRVVVAEQRHYRLVPSSEISSEDLRGYRGS